MSMGRCPAAPNPDSADADHQRHRGHQQWRRTDPRRNRGGAGVKVVAAGVGVAVPAGINVIDAEGCWVTPGLVVSVTDLGLFDVEGVEERNDTRTKSSPFNAALDIAPAISRRAQHIQVSRAGGVTRAAATPKSSTSIFAGQGAFVDLGANPKTAIRPCAFQYVELGEDGARLAGGSRVSAQALFRNALREARDFASRTPLMRRRSAARAAPGDGPGQARPLNPPTHNKKAGPQPRFPEFCSATRKAYGLLGLLLLLSTRK